ncbi:hypothetical protein [Nonlabens sp. Asnod3-A02]|jgi:hypothetical protein|uniref:hypothetical protein n=1 Tax=Nonlabens sp. Asnod3-A02 TaxID=3160579 RepID=UPI00386E72D7|tara:strand:- start:54980 stop:55225 length:246 start_codon:yes stop_codon:yes gene_type:complete
MTDEEIAKVLKYSSPNTMLIVNITSRLAELNCPFRVQVIQAIGLYSVGQILTVSSVKVTKDLITVYIISGLAYHYFHFDII